MNTMKRIVLAAVVCVAMTPFAAAPKKPASTLSAKDDEPTPMPPVLAGPDVAVLRGIQWAFEPAPLEVRSQAIEDLGFLQDPRALNPLAVLTLDAHPWIAKAAVRAVGAIRHPRAEEILCNLIRHPNASAAVKQQALSLLAFQNTPTALRFVHFTARQSGLSYELTQLARSLSAQLPTPDPDSIFGGQPVPAPPQPPPAPTAPVTGDDK